MRWYFLPIILVLVVVGEMERGESNKAPTEPTQIEEVQEPLPPLREDLGERAPMPEIDPLTPPLSPCEVDPAKVECVLEIMEM